MIVQHNMSALNTNRQLGMTTGALSKSTEKLSSGYRINRAGDDAAGLSIPEKMRGQIRGLEQGSTNAQDGISLIQTAEGALNEVHSILQRMRELAVQGSNDTNVTEDRWAIFEELSQLTMEINRIGSTTEYNTMKLFASEEMISGTGYSYFEGPGADAGTTNADNIQDSILNTAGDAAGMSDSAQARYTTVISLANMPDPVNDNAKLQVGANTSQSIKFKMNTLDVRNINSPGVDQTDTAKSVNLSADSDGTLGKLHDALANAESNAQFDTNVHETFTAAIADYDVAITNISKSRSYLGAIQNRLEHTIANADNTAENLQSAESRIRDVNMAEEMVSYSRSNILMQAGQSMLAQANQSTQGVLSLLR